MFLELCLSRIFNAVTKELCTRQAIIVLVKIILVIILDVLFIISLTTVVTLL